MTIVTPATFDPQHQWAVLIARDGALKVYCTYAGRYSCEQEVTYLREMCGIDARLGQRKQKG